MIPATIKIRKYLILSPEGISKNQISNFSDRLKGYVKTYAIETVVPHFKTELAKLPTANLHNIEVDKTGEKIWFSFPSAVETSDEYLKSRVLIELGGRNVIDPNEVHTSYSIRCPSNTKCFVSNMRCRCPFSREDILGESHTDPR